MTAAVSVLVHFMTSMLKKAVRVAVFRSTFPRTRTERFVYSLIAIFVAEFVNSGFILFIITAHVFPSVPSYMSPLTVRRMRVDRISDGSPPPYVFADAYACPHNLFMHQQGENGDFSGKWYSTTGSTILNFGMIYVFYPHGLQVRATAISCVHNPSCCARGLRDPGSIPFRSL